MAAIVENGCCFSSTRAAGCGTLVMATRCWRSAEVVHSCQPHVTSAAVLQWALVPAGAVSPCSREQNSGVLAGAALDACGCEEVWTCRSRRGSRAWLAPAAPSDEPHAIGHWPPTQGPKRGCLIRTEKAFYKATECTVCPIHTAHRALPLSVSQQWAGEREPSHGPRPSGGVHTSIQGPQFPHGPSRPTSR